MSNILFHVLLIMGISLILISVGMLVSKKMMKDLEKLSPFECGFNPRFNSRLPFSLQFFLVAMIFIIFDVELILLFPYFLYSKEIWGFYNFVLFLSILFLLTLGLIIEWNQQMLDWAI